MRLIFIYQMFNKKYRGKYKKEKYLNKKNFKADI